MRTYTVACLAGNGIGPEVMAEASRALAAVSRLHGFRVEETHPLFGGEAHSRLGHALPPATRAACATADAVLVASPQEPALAEIEADLAPSWRVDRIVLGEGRGLIVVSPLRPDATELATERAFAISRSRRARLLSINQSGRIAGRRGSRREGIELTTLTPGRAFPLFPGEPFRHEVVVTEQPYADAVADIATFGHESTRFAATGRLSERGPGIFSPTGSQSTELAGQGVANPTAMLLATALVLGEGLGQRAAARTLERAVNGALAGPARTADLLVGGVGASTREFMEAVLLLLPGSRTDHEFFQEAA